MRRRDFVRGLACASCPFSVTISRSKSCTSALGRACESCWRGPAFSALSRAISAECAVSFAASPPGLGSLSPKIVKPILRSNPAGVRTRDAGIY
jgi:hypothetical protein